MTAPKPGTDAYRWWREGALDEAHLATVKMSPDSRQMYDYVRQMAKRGESQERMVTLVARIFTADWSFKQRLRLAWKMVRR